MFLFLAIVFLVFIFGIDGVVGLIACAFNLALALIVLAAGAAVVFGLITIILETLFG